MRRKIKRHMVVYQGLEKFVRRYEKERESGEREREKETPPPLLSAYATDNPGLAPTHDITCALA